MTVINALADLGLYLTVIVLAVLGFHSSFRIWRLEQEVDRVKGVADAVGREALTVLVRQMPRPESGAGATYRSTLFACGSCGEPLDFETTQDPPRASYVHADGHQFECATGGTDAHTADLARAGRTAGER